MASLSFDQRVIKCQSMDAEPRWDHDTCASLTCHHDRLRVPAKTVFEQPGQDGVPVRNVKVLLFRIRLISCKVQKKKEKKKERIRPHQKNFLLPVSRPTHFFGESRNLILPDIPPFFHLVALFFAVAVLAMCSQTTDIHVQVCPRLFIASYWRHLCTIKV